MGFMQKPKNPFSTIDNQTHRGENGTFAHMVSGFPLMKSKQKVCVFE